MILLVGDEVKIKLDVGMRKMIYSRDPTAALLAAVLAAIIDHGPLKYYLTIVTIESISISLINNETFIVKLIMINHSKQLIIIS